MTDTPATEQTATAALRALQAKARAVHGGNTQPLLVVYAVESFLRRLAISDYADQMVLKGGMPMAANSIRRMTKDADLSTHGLPNGEHEVRDAVARICALDPAPLDGVTLDAATITTEVCRQLSYARKALLRDGSQGSSAFRALECPQRESGVLPGSGRGNLSARTSPDRAT